MSRQAWYQHPRPPPWFRSHRWSDAKAPRSYRGAAFTSNYQVGLSRCLGLDSLAVRRRVDADGAGLHGFRDLAHQVDVQEAVLQARSLHLDKVGEPKYTLECSCGNALIKNFSLPVITSLLFALHGQGVFLRLDRKLGLGESRNRDRDAIRILA